MEDKAGLRIAYSNQKEKCNRKGKHVLSKDTNAMRNERKKINL